MFRHTRPTTIVNQACMFSMVAGAVVAPRGRLFSVMAFTVTNGTITAIDPLADPQRLAQTRPHHPARRRPTPLMHCA